MTPASLLVFARLASKAVNGEWEVRRRVDAGRAHGERRPKVSSILFVAVRDVMGLAASTSRSDDRAHSKLQAAHLVGFCWYIYATVTRSSKGRCRLHRGNTGNRTHLPARVRQEVAAVEVLAHNAPLLFDVYPAEVNLIVIVSDASVLCWW